MFRSFLKGRYGFDYYTLVLLIAAIIIMKNKYFWVVGAGLAAYSLFRVFSRDINSRLEELQNFNRLMRKTWQFLLGVSNKLNKLFQPLQRMCAEFMLRLQQGRWYAFAKCPKCRNTLRLPKNKGKLLVTCPVCRHEFYYKT